jgi:hypothetical protein
MKPIRAALVWLHRLRFRLVVVAALVVVQQIRLRVLAERAVSPVVPVVAAESLRMQLSPTVEPALRAQST